jgi:ankyrin repeat protein
MKIALVLVGLLIASEGFASDLEPYLRDAGFTELHAAAWNNDSKKIAALVRSGMNVNVAANTGITPLHSAAMTGRVEAARTLISLGANLEAREAYGRTPLFLAAQIYLHPRAVLELLLEVGASSTAVDNNGKTPLDAARTDEARSTILTFQSKGKSP